MKAHHLGVLVAAAVLAVVAGLWTTNVREPENVVVGTPLLPGLAESVNDVSGVKLVGPENEVIATLTRDEQTWRLAERAGHRANVPQLRELLLHLSRARLLEEKTSNPEYYNRLGVEDIDSADAGGVLIEFEGVDVAPVIIGNSEVAREAVYARRADEATSWLASGLIDIADDTVQWLGRNIIDVSSARIAEVEITHPDGERVLVSKAAFGQPNFDVAGIPDGRELKRASIANTLADAIAGLKVDDVVPLDESGFSGLSPVRATYRAFDGYVINVDLAELDDKYLARFSAGTDAATAARYLPKDAEPDAEGDQDAGPMPAVASPLPEADLSAVAAEAAEQNRAFAGWVYWLPRSKYDQMTRRLEYLLKQQS